MLDNILVTGITDLEKYPPLSCSKYCKQTLQNDVLYIPDHKLDIESINEIKVQMCVEDYDVIETILGPKILISGCKNVKILYTANNCLQSLHSASWSMPFCEFILLGDLCYEKAVNLISDVFVGVENVCVKYFDKRMIDMCVLFILYPTFKNCQNECRKKVASSYKNYYDCKSSNSNKNSCYRK